MFLQNKIYAYLYQLYSIQDYKVIKNSMTRSACNIGTRQALCVKKLFHYVFARYASAPPEDVC